MSAREWREAGAGLYRTGGTELTEPSGAVVARVRDGWYVRAWFADRPGASPRQMTDGAMRDYSTPMALAEEWLDKREAEARGKDGGNANTQDR